MREKARLRKAEAHISGLLHFLEEREGVPVVLFDAYADAIERYGLEDRRGMTDEGPTVSETTAEARTSYQQMIEAMSAYTFEGGRDRWEAFGQAASGYGQAAFFAVANARSALHAPGVGFSEHTDPAFAGLVE